MTSSTIPGNLPNWAELTPAYRRDYATAAKVKAAFAEGRDFYHAATGQATSLRDGVIAPGTTILLRYKRLTMVTTFTVTKASIDKALATTDEVLSGTDQHSSKLPIMNDWQKGGLFS